MTSWQNDKEDIIVGKKAFLDVEVKFMSYTANVLLVSAVTLGVYDIDDVSDFGDLTPKM